MVRAIKPKGGQRWENRFQYTALATNADEAEWQAVLNGIAHVSAGTTDEAMAEAGDEFAPASAEALLKDDVLQGQEMLQEARQGSVFELLVERKKLLGAAYPFDIDGTSLIYRPAAVPIYELLLGICKSPSLTQAPYYELPRLFENLSVLAGRGYVGPQAQGYRMGWPRPTTMARFKAAIGDLRIKSGDFESEWQWEPAEHLPEDPSPKFVKEEGLDVVIWSCWPDGRTGQLYLLGQCACGEDWLTKTKELDLDDFGQWFRLPRVRPVRSFFTPRYAVKSILNDMTFKAGLVFDRVRMVSALSAPHVANDVNLLSASIQTCLGIAKQPLAD